MRTTEGTCGRSNLPASGTLPQTHSKPEHQSFVTFYFHHLKKFRQTLLGTGCLVASSDLRLSWILLAVLCMHIFLPALLTIPSTLTTTLQSHLTRIGSSGFFMAGDTASLMSVDWSFWKKNLGRQMGILLQSVATSSINFMTWKDVQVPWFLTNKTLVI